HVTHNGIELFGQFLGTHEETGYSNTVALGEADTVDFIVGRGQDGNASGSALKITATLRLLTGSNESRPATILTPPLSQSVVSGTTVLFSVAADGTQPLGYQWRFNGNPLPGKTNSTLTLDNVQVVQAGNYSVVVTNAFGSVTSPDARLTVNPLIIG